MVLLAGTDVSIPMMVPGVSLHQELELLVEAGLTPLETLRAATLNPAAGDQRLAERPKEAGPRGAQKNTGPSFSSRSLAVTLRM